MAQFKIWLLIFISTTLAYFGSLRYGFSQDDYFFLFISKAGSVGEVLQFFSPWHQQGFPFFRPLGTQLYYFLFNQNPFSMHVFMLLLQSFNGYLVYKLVSKLFKDNHLTSIMIGILYAISSVHFLSLFYIAATQQLLAATFGLLSLNAFASKKYLSAALYLVPGILSKESALVVPGIATLIYLYDSGKLSFLWIKKYLFAILPYIVVIALYLGLRLFAGIHIQSEYQPVFGPSLISTIRWYILFGFGAPEELLRYGLSGMSIRLGQFITDFGYLGLVSVVSTGIGCLYFVYRVVTSLFYRDWGSKKQTLILLTWFILGIILIIWYPDHRYPHYLDLSLIPLLYLVIGNTSSKLKYFIFSTLVVASISSIMLSTGSHWTTGRAKIVESALHVYDWEAICAKENVAFVGEGSKPLELSYALSLGNGPRVICNNSSLGVYYLTAEALAKEVEGDTMPEDVFIVDIKDLTK